MSGKAETTVCPSKAKTIRQSHINFSWLRLIRRIIAVESICQAMQINGGRHDILVGIVSIAVIQ